MFKITTNAGAVAERLRQYGKDLVALQDAINNAHIDMGADDAFQRVDEIVEHSACRQSNPEIAENMRVAIHAKIAESKAKAAQAVENAVSEENAGSTS